MIDMHERRGRESATDLSWLLESGGNKRPVRNSVRVRETISNNTTQLHSDLLDWLMGMSN